MLFSNEVNETRVEQMKQARKVFFDNENKKLQEQIEDLTTTVNINKEMMSEMFSNPDPKRADQTMLRKLN
jgi:hypothetical protein